MISRSIETLAPKAESVSIGEEPMNMSEQISGRVYRRGVWVLLGVLAALATPAACGVG